MMLTSPLAASIYKWDIIKMEK